MAFNDYRDTDSSSAFNAAAITPNNDADLANYTRGIYVGTTGNVKVDMVLSGTAITFVAVPAGVVLPIRAKKVYATGTTASTLIALW